MLHEAHVYLSAEGRQKDHVQRQLGSTLLLLCSRDFDFNRNLKSTQAELWTLLPRQTVQPFHFHSPPR